MTAHAEGTTTVASWEEDTYQDLAGQEKLLVEDLGHGWRGAQRIIGDPHGIPGDALAVERRLGRGMAGGVDVHGCHETVLANGQGWPGYLDGERVTDANGPLGGPEERAVAPAERPGRDRGGVVEGFLAERAGRVDAHGEARRARFAGSQGVAALVTADGGEFVNAQGPGRRPLGTGG